MDGNNRPLDAAVKFDARYPEISTNLVGVKYFDLPDPYFGSSLGLSDVHAKVFYGVSGPPPSLFSVYLGLRSPRGLTDRPNCSVQPVILSYGSKTFPGNVVLRGDQPYAWLGRIRFGEDESVTWLASTGPALVSDLATFSKDRSSFLCQSNSVCGTTDAAYAMIVSKNLQRGVSALSGEQERALKPKDTFKECDSCPDMVVVPAGVYLMGSPDGEKDRSPDEGPQRRIVMDKPFAVGRFSVTFAEWDTCVADNGCDGYSPSDKGWGRGLRPVINVSWNDAQTFTRWLSAKTGKTYRLLTEEEREYVTRAGTTSVFWWGESASTAQANYDGTFTYGNTMKGKYEQKTLPVDSFKSNPWGLFQVHGNIWEWVENCWNNANCEARVRRGGSWRNHPKFLRSAARGPSNAAVRQDNIGFRVAREFDS
jgi:formylglycine-generating enzyme required for sulfatase activity